MSFSRKYLFGAFLMCFVIQGVFSQGADVCRTPDQGTGTCVPLKQCQSLLDVIRSLKTPIPTPIKEKIKAYTCATRDGGRKVCCPPGPINLDLDTEPTTPTDPPDVTNHKNIKLLPETCGLFESAEKIVRGNNSALNEFPWMALLQYRSFKDNQLSFRCGGTIINKNYILTAAHCVSNVTNHKLVSVRVGEYSIKNETDCELQPNKQIKCNPPVQNLKIEEVIPHYGYGGSTGLINDIALIRVSTINLNVENARPVCLPIGIVRDFSFRGVVVTGWGLTNIWTDETADILQKVGLPVYNKDDCVKAYKKRGISVARSHICAGGVNRDSCGGDSGGPMLVPTPVGEEVIIVYVQQGIVSFGPKFCGESEFPGVYTAVKYYMDWILDNMKK